jgi:hypothetical protein
LITENFSFDPALLLNASTTTALVDWVWLELRSPTSPATVIASRPALVRRDGSVVDMNGSSSVQFYGVQHGNYYVAVRHRNHLGCMTSSTVALVESGNLEVDFTDILTETYGSNARKTVSGKAVLWGGDATGNGRLVASGGSTDVNPVTSAVLTAPGNPTFSGTYQLLGYNIRDLNLDGKTVFAGAASDVNIITSNILTHPSNASSSPTFQVVVQLPQ